MADSAFDLAMFFITQEGDTTIGESLMQKHPNDTLMEGFEPAQGYTYYSNFFEITSFDFTLTLEPDEQGSGHGAGGANQHHARPAPGAHGGAAAAEKKGPFDRWRSATPEEARRMNFPLKFEEFNFSRVIDGASPVFFDSCANKKYFRKAVLIKRVSTGRAVEAQTASLSFLRMEFEHVQIKSLAWTDGDLVTERCTFKCDKMIYKYRQQAARGSLMELRQAEWSRDRDSLTRRRTS